MCTYIHTYICILYVAVFERFFTYKGNTHTFTHKDTVSAFFSAMHVLCRCNTHMYVMYVYIHANTHTHLTWCAHAVLLRVGSGCDIQTSSLVICAQTSTKKVTTTWCNLVRKPLVSCKSLLRFWAASHFWAAKRSSAARHSWAAVTLETLSCKSLLSCAEHSQTFEILPVDVYAKKKRSKFDLIWKICIWALRGSMLF